MTPLALRIDSLIASVGVSVVVANGSSTVQSPVRLSRGPFRTSMFWEFVIVIFSLEKVALQSLSQS